MVAVSYVLYRLFAHTSAMLAPAVITPHMDVHRALSPDLSARVDRLLHEPSDRVRQGRPRLIALTFDDGPYAVTTPLLLGVLGDLRVPATFFLIGRDAEQFPELTERIERLHHEIANHTYSHPNLDQLGDRAVRMELVRGRAVLGRLARDPGIATLFRPPHGRYTEETIKVAQSVGYHTVFWSDDGGDWRLMSPVQLAAHLESHASAPEIVLLHNGSLATVFALPDVVRRFQAAGYQFVTVSQLLTRAPAEQVNHPAKNPV